MSEVEQCAIAILRAALAVAADNLRAATGERDAALKRIAQLEAQNAWYGVPADVQERT